jgi:hypothetical protein
VAIYKLLAELMKSAPSAETTDTSPAAQAPVKPSTAEYLDAVDACLTLPVQPKRGEPQWDEVEKLVLWKPRDTIRTT